MDAHNDEIVSAHKKTKLDQEVEKNVENPSSITALASAYKFSPLTITELNQEVVKNVENPSSITALASAYNNSENHNASNSDMSCEGEATEIDQDVDDDEDIDEDDSHLYNDSDGEGYFYGEDDDDNYASMQAQFDSVDLPPGVEASVSWMETTLNSNNSKKSAPTNDSAEVFSQLPFSVPPHVSSGGAYAPERSSFRAAESGTSGKEKEETIHDVLRNYIYFKQFDVVDDHSDHHYNDSGFKGLQPPKEWAKKIQDEWKILENDLPGTIYVRVYESRMDLLRAVIVGPQGTPYHDGLFVFDVVFPPNYPNTPPMVYYYSGGLRLNPNLYDCGKVCLSLLGTWTGKGSEKWQPKESTMLQVLVSIQALILNADPYYNEPGYESQKGSGQGDAQSKAYSENAFILSLKTMMYTIRRPPKHFEDLVAGHFRTFAHDILSACKAYTEGVLIGTLVNGKVPTGTEAQMTGSRTFKETVRKMINGLVSNFSKCGIPDCEQFRVT